MRIAVGQEAEFEAGFFSSGTTPALLDESPEVAFYGLDEEPALVGTTVTVENVSPGTWKATLTIPQGTVPDWYKIVWTAAVGGTPLAGSENFQVVEPDWIPMTEEENLRRRLNDPAGDDTFFLDDEIHSLLALAGMDVMRAALDGWAIKMAYFSDSVDIVESGSERKGSQLFRQAKMMADFYSQAIKDRLALEARSLSVPVGVVINLRGERNDIFGWSYNPFSLSTTTPYVRLFPLKRFMDAYYLAMTEGWAS